MKAFYEMRASSLIPEIYFKALLKANYDLPNLETSDVLKILSMKKIAEIIRAIKHMIGADNNEEVL